MSIHLEKNQTVSHLKQTFLSTLAVMNIFFFWKSCEAILGLKSHPKLNIDNDECLVKFSYQKTQGIERSKTWIVR